MASKRSIDQVNAWLQNKIAEKDTLDSINAELCLNVIESLKTKLDRLGVQFHQVRSQLERTKRWPNGTWMEAVCNGYSDPDMEGDEA